MKEKIQHLPSLNDKILQIIKNQFNGNVSLFARTIGFKQQTIDRLFKIDPRTDKYPNVSGKMIVALTSNLKNIDKDWLLQEREVNEGGIEGGIEGGNSKNANLNEGSYPKTWDETGACTEEFPADKGNGCENCKKLETDIFVLRDIIKGKNLSIEQKDSRIEDLNRNIGRLELKNEQLQADNAKVTEENTNLKAANKRLEEHLKACHCGEEESPLSNAV